MRIAILALQGAFAEHAKMMQRLGQHRNAETPTRVELV